MPTIGGRPPIQHTMAPMNGSRKNWQHNPTMIPVFFLNLDRTSLQNWHNRCAGGGTDDEGRNKYGGAINQLEKLDWDQLPDVN